MTAPTLDDLERDLERRLTAVKAARAAGPRRKELARRLALADLPAARELFAQLCEALAAEEQGSALLGHAPPAAPQPEPSGENVGRTTRSGGVTTAVMDTDPSGLKPPSGLVLPCHREGDLYVFRDPADVQVALSCGVPSSFAASRLEGVAAHVLRETGRTLLPFDLPPKKGRKPRKAKEPPAPAPPSAPEPADADADAALLADMVADAATLGGVPAENGRLVEVAPGCVLEVSEAEGGTIYATPPEGRDFGNWHDRKAPKPVPCEEDIAGAVGGALGSFVQMIGHTLEKGGRPSFILRRMEENGAKVPSWLFGPQTPTAQEGGL